MTIMEQNINFQAVLKELLEPIIDDCITRAMNKYINELRYDRPINENILGMKEASEYLKISKATMYNLTMGRQIPYYKMGRRNFFKKEELMRLHIELTSNCFIVVNDNIWNFLFI